MNDSDHIENKLGTIIKGEKKFAEEIWHELQNIKVDKNFIANKGAALDTTSYTINQELEIFSKGTFNGKKTRKIRFLPNYDAQGWWLRRTDINNRLFKVSHKNAVARKSNGINNIILGNNWNNDFIKLTEHIISLKVGLNIDNLIIEFDSEDPPLFENGSQEIFELLNNAEKKPVKNLRKRYFTVKNTVTAVWPDGSLLLAFPPQENYDFKLNLDCAINFDSALGEQRIKLSDTYENFYRGSEARTNTSFKQALLSKTIGKLIPDIKNLGYDSRNVLIAGKSRYINKPKLVYNNKSLEAIWHRAVLDLAAAISLIDEGKFVGNIISYKAGHRHDLEFIKLFYEKNLLKEIKE